MTTRTRISLRLPAADGAPARATHWAQPGPWTRPAAPITSRIAYAAAHVVPSRWADNTPGAPAVIDWDATLAYRHELWSYGLGVADAMDTAQRGMGLDWAATRELIKRSGAEAAAVGGLLACGAGTDQLDLPRCPTAGPGSTAVIERLPRADRRGHRGRRQRHPDGLPRAGPPSPAARRTTCESTRRCSTRSTSPVILHWLGTMFDPALAGYWGSGDVAAATGRLSST